MDEDKNAYWREDEVLPPGYCREMLRPSVGKEYVAMRRENQSVWSMLIKPADVPYPFANTYVVASIEVEK